MPQPICVLSTRLANQIAAGEVVERPASVVKELLENSIDANATKIKIEIENGGVNLIRIIDNGHGIPQEQLAVALSRHATSKISSLQDLEELTSLGFRGEALASISSVAKLVLSSNTKEQQHAFQVKVAGDNNMNTEVIPVAHPVGTTVEVKDLFFNVPARRKFLKTIKTETFHIEEVIKRIALTNFALSFELKHNGKTIFNYPVASTDFENKRRISQIISTDFINNSIPIDATSTDLQMTGWISLPTFSRSNADMQYFFINGRIVKDKLVNHAIRQAYADVLYRGSYPLYSLYLTISPNMIDVNVHPTKHEVRFRNSNSAYRFIFNSIKQALLDTKPQHSSFKEQTIDLNHTVAQTADKPEPTASWQQTFNTIKSTHKVEDTPASESASLIKPSIKPFSVQIAKSNTNKNENSQPAVMHTDYQKNIVKFNEDKLIDNQIGSNLEEITHKTVSCELDIPPLGFAIAQLKGIYILAENANGMIIVDMHAAHERITYERMKHDFYTNNIAAQPLLLPKSISLNTAEIECAKLYLAKLTQLGLQLEIAGENSFIIRTVPVLLQESDVTQLVRDVIRDLLKFGTLDKVNQKINEVLATMSCHSAIRANKKLSIAEMNALLRQMEATNHSNQCNHGRPTWMELSLQHIDKIFSRGN